MENQRGHADCLDNWGLLNPNSSAVMTLPILSARDLENPDILVLHAKKGAVVASRLTRGLLCHRTDLKPQLEV